MAIESRFLEPVTFEFQRYKTLGDKTFAQLGDQAIHWRPGETDNSIAVLTKHLAGNMLSRWTHFLTQDGEKPWRDRDSEFLEPPSTKTEMIRHWEKAWQCLFDNLGSLGAEDLTAQVKIRGEEHGTIAAILRQLAHCAYHVGQIVYLGKAVKGGDWKSLSIPLGGSAAFNAKMFGSPNP